MHRPGKNRSRRSLSSWNGARAFGMLAGILSWCLLSGCAALTNPVADGLPARLVPPELLGRSKEGARTIPLTLLRQKPPAVYKLAAGDILGVWIEGVLGERNQPPPIRSSDQAGQPPALGFPIPVREDGTIPLPLVEPVKVEGMSVTQAQEAVRKAYTVQKQILKPGGAGIIVTLIRRRQYHILVIRQDSAGGVTHQEPLGYASNLFGSESSGFSNKRGQGFSVDLPAYENDVLNALAQSGGLPGLDAANEVVIQRGYFNGAQDGAAALRDLGALPPGCNPISAGGRGGRVIRIPLRARPGETPPINPEDIILQTGDIVFIESRDAEVYYTAGLLPAGEYQLPRDTDLDVVQAIIRIRGLLVSGGITASNLSGNTISGGIGAPSPSLLTVLRQTPGGRQVRIRVDLNRALRDPRERILVQAKDVLILQETAGEALTRYFTQTFRFNLNGTVIRQRDLQGTATLNVP